MSRQYTFILGDSIHAGLGSPMLYECSVLDALVAGGMHAW